MIRDHTPGRGAATLLLAALALPAAAFASDGDVKFQTRLTPVPAASKDSPATHKLVYSGELGGLPAGTRIDIRFRLMDNKQHINWYRALSDENEKLAGESQTLDKPLAPGLYEAQFWLQMRSQSSANRKWFRLNRGYTNRHREVLESARMRIGSPADAEAFTESCLAKLRGYLGPLTTLTETLGELIENKTPKADAWAAQYKAHYDTLAGMQVSFREWRLSHAAMPLEGERNRLYRLLTNVFVLFEGYDKGHSGLDGSLSNARDDVRGLSDALTPQVPAPDGPASPESRPSKGE
jgi:hypothetical protein